MDPKNILVLLICLSVPVLCAGGALLDVTENAGVGSPLIVETSDSEGDGLKEIIVGNNDGVYLLESNGSMRWTYVLKNTKSIHVSDTNSDGVKEVLIASGEFFNNKERGNLYVLDEKGNLTYKFEYLTTGKWYPQFIYNSMETVDLDSDRYKELIVGCSGGVYALGDTFDRIRWSIRTNETITSVRRINTSENESEMLLASSFHWIYLLSMNGSLVRSLNVEEGIKQVIPSDIYPEAGEEIFLVTDDDMINVLSSNLTVHVRKNPADGITNAVIMDLDGDKYKEFALAARGYVHVLDNRLNEYGRHKVADVVTGLQSAEWDGEDGKEIVFSSGRQVYWISKYGDLLGNYSINDIVLGIHVDDLDFDGYSDLVVFTGDRVVSIENKALKVKDDAKDLYAEALGFVAEGRYDDAKERAASSLMLYTEIGDLKGANLCRDLLEDIDTLSFDMKVDEAESYCESAARYYASQDKEKAAEYLKKAMDAYAGINYTLNDSKCDEVYLNMAKENNTGTPVGADKNLIEAPSTESIMLVLSIALLAIVLIGFVVLVFKKK